MRRAALPARKPINLSLDSPTPPAYSECSGVTPSPDVANGLTESQIRSLRHYSESQESKTASRVYTTVIFILALLSFVVDDIRVLALPRDADNYIDAVLFALAAAFCWDFFTQVRSDEQFLVSFFAVFEVVAIAGILMDARVVAEQVFRECDTRHFLFVKLIPKAARISRFATQFIGYLTLNNVPVLKKVEASKTEALAFSSETRVRKASSVVPFREGDLLVSNTVEVQRPRDASRQRTTVETAIQRIRKIATFKKLMYQGKTTSSVQSMRIHTINSLTESRISKDVTRGLVTLMILIGMTIILCSWITIPAFTFVDSAKSHTYGLGLLEQGWHYPLIANLTAEYINAHSGESNLERLVELDIKGTHMFLTNHNARRSEICTYEYEGITATFLISTKAQILSILDLTLSLFFFFLLLTVCVRLRRDIRNMILFPLERMIETVRLMSRNPLQFVKFTPFTRSYFNPKSKNCCQGSVNYAEAEIRHLENAFRKIGVMLALVYGTAGSELISSTLQYEVDFSPLVQGKEVLALFCFAKIADFEVCLEALQAKTFAYVNLIAKFVHYTCEKYFGGVNRNLGDAFLLVWKFPSEEGIMVNSQRVLNPYSQSVKTTTSLALLSAIKSIKKTARSQQLFRQYHKTNSKEKLPTTLLTFGFHSGWAFEGAIGSGFKIDASYLSPNVNTASRVQSAATMYQVAILMSNDVYFLIEEEVQSMLRHIDTVQLKGVQSPVELYSFDITETHFGLTAKLPRKEFLERKKHRLKEALDRRFITAGQMMTKSESIAKMRTGLTDEFFRIYADGLKLYLKGEWKTAFTAFENCLRIAKFDHPTKLLMEFIEENGFEAPLCWNGVRKLESK